MRLQSWLMLLFAAALPVSATAQQRWVGHWVNVDPADYAVFVLDIQPDGQVHRLMPAPQFQAKYRFDAGRLVMRMGDGSADSSLALRGDTLVGRGPGAMLRIPGSVVEHGGVRGTWRGIASAQMSAFMTLRSDAEVVLEVGFPGTTSWRGDTLQFSAAQSPSGSAQLPSAVYVIRQAGDTLHAIDVAGKDRRFVRRPWGCLGVVSFDAAAPECK